MNFNFSAAPAVRTSMYLAPWEIYKVKFVEAKLGERKNNKDVTAPPYKVLELHFQEVKADGSNGGTYTETIFFPTEQSAVRPTYERPDGSSYSMPSQFERTMGLISQVCTVLNPTGFKKMQEISSKFRSFDDVAAAVLKVLAPAKGKETNMKLVGSNSNGKVMATSPRTVALTKDGEVWTCDNFIGDNVSFSSYEEGKRKEYKNSTPVAMESTSTGSDNNLDIADTRVSPADELDSSMDLASLEV